MVFMQEQSSSKFLDTYLLQVAEERKPIITALRNVVAQHLPHGFEETINYGMLSYVVPHSIYPPGYHCNPSEPLPFLSLASQKNFVSLYHMAIYADPEILKWFQETYHNLKIGRLDMGKSCIRFKKPELIPMDLIAELCAKINPQQWIALYERTYKPPEK